MARQPDFRPALVSELILYIVDQLNAMGHRPSTVQMVKFLYLIDVEHQRRIGKPLTGLNWVHYHFGPYAFELPDLMESLGYQLEGEAFEGQRGRGVAFSAKVEGSFLSELPGHARAMVDRVLGMWGDASTREILDYVYFDTEPMIGTKEGEKLDLSKARKPFGSYELKFNLSKKQLKTSLKAPNAAETGEVKPPDEFTLRFDDPIRGALSRLEDD